MPPRRRWPLVILAGALVLLVAGFVVLRVVLDDSTTPIDAAKAVEEFRQDQEPASTVEPTTAAVVRDPLPALPGPGVYVYDTLGEESVDALGGARHEFPPTTTVTVQTTDCGVSLTWDALVERSETIDLCATADGLVMVGYSALHEFFSQADRQSLICTEPVLLVPSEVPSEPISATCSNEDLSEDLAVSMSRGGSKLVGAAEVEVVDVVVDVLIGPVTGSTTGSSRSEFSFAVDSGALVSWSEITRTVAKSAIGDVTYDESFALQLAELEPRT